VVVVGACVGGGCWGWSDVVGGFGVAAGWFVGTRRDTRRQEIVGETETQETKKDRRARDRREEVA